MTLFGAFLNGILLFLVLVWFVAMCAIGVCCFDPCDFKWRRAVIGCVGLLVLFTLLIYGIANSDNAVKWIEEKSKPMTAERGL